MEHPEAQTSFRVEQQQFARAKTDRSVNPETPDTTTSSNGHIRANSHTPTSETCSINYHTFI